MRHWVVHSRRHLLKTALAGAAGVALGAPALRLAAQAAALPANTTRLADNLYLIALPGQANVLARTGPEGVLLVDGASSAAADALMTTVAALPGGGAVQAIFNTHWHPEQTGSNVRLGTAGKAIIAQENTRLWLAADVTWPWNGQTFTRLPKIAQPNHTFYDAGRPALKTVVPPARLLEGVRYDHIPDVAHTDGDLYVHFVEPNVLAVGDVITGQGWPTVDWATGGWIGGIVGGIQRLSSVGNEDTRIVPARGPVLSWADLKTQADMYGTIYERLTQLLNKGRGPGEAVEAKPAKEFEARMGNPDEFVRRAFESLWAYLSPDA